MPRDEEKKRIWEKEYREKNKERAAIYHREYYEKNRAALLEAQKRKRAENPGKEREYFRRRYIATRQRHRDWTKARSAFIKSELLDAYGRECACCSEKRFEFLSLDHFGLDKGVDSTWKQYSGRSKPKKQRGLKEWRRLRDLGWPKGDYRILCMNCNCATSYGRICPHEKEKSA